MFPDASAAAMADAPYMLRAFLTTLALPLKAAASADLVPSDRSKVSGTATEPVNRTIAARHVRNRFYPGLENVAISRAVRVELLLSQVQAAIAHQTSWRRPWQRYEPLSAFLNSDFWPTD